MDKSLKHFMNKSEYKPVLVVWEDTRKTKDYVWYETKAVANTRHLKTFTTGFLVSENEESIKLAVNHYLPDMFREFFVIPRKNIIGLIYLDFKEKR